MIRVPRNPLKTSPKVNVLVIGDATIDEDLFFDRSESGPPPTVAKPTIRRQRGGAGAVALMATTLGANVKLVGGVSYWPRPSRTRYIANGEVLLVEEDAAPIPETIAEEVARRVCQC